MTRPWNLFDLSFVKQWKLQKYRKTIAASKIIFRAYRSHRIGALAEVVGEAHWADAGEDITSMKDLLHTVYDKNETKGKFIFWK